jgi:hypothetical protein
MTAALDSAAERAKLRRVLGRLDTPGGIRAAWLVTGLATGWSALAAACLLWPGLGTANPDAHLPAGFTARPVRAPRPPPHRRRDHCHHRIPPHDQHPAAALRSTPGHSQLQNPYPIARSRLCMYIGRNGASYPGRKRVLTAIACPECGAPADIMERFSLPSTDGPVAHVAVSCAVGHHLRMAADRLPAGSTRRTSWATSTA